MREYSSESGDELDTGMDGYPSRRDWEWERERMTSNTTTGDEAEGDDRDGDGDRTQNEGDGWVEESGGSERQRGEKSGGPGEEEDESSLENGSGPDLGRVTTALAVIVTLAIGVGLGDLSSMVGAVLLALVLVGSLSPLASASLRHQALGSCGFVLAFVALAVSPLVVSPVAVVGALAVGVIASALVVREECGPIVGRTFRDSAVLGAIVAGVIGGFLALIVHDGLAVSANAGSHVLAAVTPTPFTALVSASVLCLVTLVLFDLVSPILEPWLPTGVSLPSVSIPSFAGSLSFLEDISSDTAQLLLFVLGVVLVVLYFSLVALAQAFNSVLLKLGPVGVAVQWSLQSGVLHVPLAVGAVAALCVLVASALAPAGRLWLGSYPLRTLALGAGGAVAATTAVIAMTALSSVPSPASAWAVLVVLVAGLVLVTAAMGITSFATELGVRVRRFVLAVGAALVFVTTVLAASAGIEPVVVFAGVAASILVWDLGENVLTMRHHLGEDVDTREPELVHASASVLVGCLGVGVAALAMYGLGNVSPPGERWQALAPLVLALTALVVLVLAAQRSDSPALRPTQILTHADRLPAMYRVVVGTTVCGLTAVVLALLGYGHVVLFALILIVPLVLVALADKPSTRVYDRL